jgi:hypothetical protein
MYKELTSAIARSLDGKGIPYMLIGGQAVLVHGEPRLTRDIDITLGVGPEGLDLEGTAVRFVSPEDLIIHKLLLAAPATSRMPGASSSRIPTWTGTMSAGG